MERGETQGKVVLPAMNLVDLTRLLDPSDIDRLPPERRAGATPLFPLVKHISPKMRAPVMSQIFGCTPEDLPEGEGWGDEHVRMSTHLGTHVDAPLHYGSLCEGRPSRTISDIDISELYCPAVVLDLRGKVGAGEGIGMGALESAIAENGSAIEPGSAILLRTGQSGWLTRQGVLFLPRNDARRDALSLWASARKILGTDALRAGQALRRDGEGVQGDGRPL